jgi:hypothetical protein
MIFQFPINLMICPIFDTNFFMTMPYFL